MCIIQLETLAQDQHRFHVDSLGIVLKTTCFNDLKSFAYCPPTCWSFRHLKFLFLQFFFFFKFLCKLERHRCSRYIDKTVRDEVLYESLCVCHHSPHSAASLSHPLDKNTHIQRSISPSNGKIEHYIKARAGYEPLCRNDGSKAER